MQIEIEDLSSRIEGVRKELAAGHRRLRTLQDRHRQHLARLGTHQTSLNVITALCETDEAPGNSVDAHPSGNPAQSGPATTQEPSSMFSCQSEYKTQSMGGFSTADAEHRDCKGLEVAEIRQHRPRCVHVWILSRNPTLTLLCWL